MKYKRLIDIFQDTDSSEVRFRQVCEDANVNKYLHPFHKKQLRLRSWLILWSYAIRMFKFKRVSLPGKNESYGLMKMFKNEIHSKLTNRRRVQ